MGVKIYNTYHLVKSEDLNHHGTLYAGRSAEWFVESGFMAAASLTRPENIVCMMIHGMMYQRPVCLGEIIVRGFVTFVHVDRDGKPLAHGLTITAETPKEAALQEQARKVSYEGKGR